MFFVVLTILEVDLLVMLVCVLKDKAGVGTLIPIAEAHTLSVDSFGMKHIKHQTSKDDETNFPSLTFRGRPSRLRFLAGTTPKIDIRDGTYNPFILLAIVGSYRTYL